MAVNRTGPPLDLRLLLAVLAVVTVVLAGLVAAAVWHAVVPADAPTTSGQVVKVDTPSGNNGTNWIEISYTLPDGRQLSSRTTQFRVEDAAVGRPVQIRYAPDDPKRIAVAGVTESWTSRWLYVVLAAIAELAILIAVLRRWQRDRMVAG
ncbi:DUF3592 domain-containing protein [Kribbella sp. NPDC004875]|uniref:DUF3592 domain-containing protein n=1 Tax=Kribbella sp. NPDC004875 TaxID=3364107 RepID=UPI003693802F